MASGKLTAALAAGLFLSLCVNVFFAGRMLGHAVQEQPAAAFSSDRDSRREEWKKREEALHAALSAEDRAVMVAARAEHDALFQPLRDALDAARTRVSEAMAAEPADPAALDAAIAAESAAKAALLREMTTARRQVMERLSPAGRETLREMMPLRRGVRDGQRGKPPHGFGAAPTPEGGKAFRAPLRPAPDMQEGADNNEAAAEDEAPGFAPEGEDLQPPSAPDVTAP